MLTLSLNQFLGLKEALEMLHLPNAGEDEDERLSDGPPQDALVGALARQAKTLLPILQTEDSVRTEWRPGHPRSSHGPSDSSAPSGSAPPGPGAGAPAAAAPSACPWRRFRGSCWCVLPPECPGGRAGTQESRASE